MPTNNKSIQILRGNKSRLSNDLKKTKLEPGQPFFDKDAKTLQIGDGSGVIGDNISGNDGSNLATAPYVTVKDGAIIESKLDTGSVTNAKIRDRAINDAKIADDAAIKGSKLADASNGSNPTGITAAKIENSAVTGLKIANGSISDSKVATDADINGSKFKRNSIRGDRLADAGGDVDVLGNPSGITTGKIEDNAITTPKLHDNAITPAKIDPKGNYTLNYLIIKKDGEDTGIIDVEHHLGVINNNVIAQYYADRIEAQAAILKYPDLKGDTDTIAVLSNIPKFQSIDGNLYITT